MKDLYIIGSGGFGREVAWLVERINGIRKEWDIRGFIDDNHSKHGNICGGYSILGDSNYLQTIAKEKVIWVVCAVGNSKTRKEIIQRIEKNSNIKFATLVDPSVIYSKRVKIGEGSIICAGNIFTVDITIGKHVIVNLDCTIGHDSIIEDYVTIYPSVNVSGNVTVHTCTELGTGSKIIQGVYISGLTILGAGAVVNKNIEESGTYVGVPARKIK